MKTLNVLVFLVVAATLVAGCGKHQKNPAKDLKTLRAKAAKEELKGPDKAQTIRNDIVVEKPVTVIKEQATVTANSFVITAPPTMDFIEGQKASYEVRARSLVPGVSIKLKATGLPAGVEPVQSESEADLYTITWSPSYHTVPHGKYYSRIEAKLFIEITEVKDEKLKAKVEGLVRDEQVLLQVFPSQEGPSNLKVELPSEIAEDTITPFTVTAKVPGIDENSQARPRLVISYDSVNRTAGSDIQELDGSRHIISETKAEYIASENVWKFNPIFDTKNIPVQPALGLNGQVVKNSPFSKVRLSFKVHSPYGPSTPEIVKQVKITLVRAPDAPKFDMSNLGQQTLQVTQGETTKFAFSVYSINQKATIALDLPSLKAIPGSPTLECKGSSQVPSRKDCVLTWNVPCSATDFSLENQITMSATATSGNRTSEATVQTLKTMRSKKQVAAACKPKPAAPKQNEKPKQNEPPKTEEPKPVNPPSTEGAP